MKNKILGICIVAIFLLANVAGITALSVEKEQREKKIEDAKISGGPTLHQFEVHCSFYRTPNKSWYEATIVFQGTDPDGDNLLYMAAGRDKVYSSEEYYPSGDVCIINIENFLFDYVGNQMEAWCIDDGDYQTSNHMIDDVSCPKCKEKSILEDQSFCMNFPFLTMILKAVFMK